VFTACWSPKGGSGTTVVAVALARVLADGNHMGALVVDLAGDVPAVLGCPEPDGPGVAEWLAAGPGVPADGLARLERGHDRGLAWLPRGQVALAGAARAEVLAAVLATERRPVVVDCGTVGGSLSGRAGEVGRVLASAATSSLLVVRPCYLALRRAVAAAVRPTGIVVVGEPGRALEPNDIAEVVGAPLVAVVHHDAAVARAVDAGLLGARLPASLATTLRGAT
jgi:hypothetical protein